MATKKTIKRKYQIQRDFDILQARDNGYDTPTMIANSLGVTYDVAKHTLKTYRMIADHGDEYEYIDISLELCELLDEAGCDVDRCLTLIMRELWINGFNTRDKIAKITEDELEMLIHGHRIHRAGKKATEVFLMWQLGYAEALRKRKAEKAKPKSRTSASKVAAK